MGFVAGLQPGDPREIGPYRLLGQLGSGGMGQVFLGVSAGGRPIAVKVILADLADDPEFRTRFRSEVEAARKVSGLFTAIVVDADLDGPIPWLATAYVAGPSLAEAVRSHGPLPAGTLLALAGGLAESLSAIHDAGVVHRDLKPSNVLLAEDGPRVIDFGISEAAEASPVAGVNVIGSPGYMSPEQVMGLDVGPASDMFSLGAVLAFAGTAEGPFGSGSNAAVIHRLVNDQANLAKLPDEVRPLVGKLLAKHPNDRPTARELLALVGPVQPAKGWLSESIIYGSAEGESAVELLNAASAGTVMLFAGPAVGQPGPGGEGQARHRLSRPVASVGITGGLVAASAAAVFVLTGASPHTPAPPTHTSAPLTQPRAGVALTAPAATAPVSVTPRSSSSVSPASPAANAAMSPSLSQFLTTPPPATVTPAASPAPAKSPAGSASPSASSSSSSPSATASSSPSPTASASASPSPSPSPSATASSSPSPTASASASLSAAPSPSAPASPSAAPSPTQSTSASPSSSTSQSASPIASVSVSPSASAS